MNKIIIIFTLLFSSASFAESLDFQITPMVGMGFRFDTSNSDYSNSYNNERNDAFFLTGKVFFGEHKVSQSSILVGGIGYHYQLNNCHDISISPFAIKGPEGLAFSLDLFQSNVRGGWAGFSVGFSF